MRIRTLVPAIACLAAVPAFVAAADSAASIKPNGYIDTSLTATETADDGHKSIALFGYDLKLGAEVAVTDKVSGVIDMVFDGNNSSAGGTATNSNQFTIRNAYGQWLVAPDYTLKTGKQVGPIGWVAAFSPDLWRVNKGPIVNLYGQDWVGADVTWAKEGMPVTVEVAVTNGFFGEANENEARQGNAQGDKAFAYIFDVAYALPDKKGTVDAEFVFDTDAANTANAGKGHGVHLGLNATLNVAPATKVGLEGICQSIAVPSTYGGTGDERAISNTGLLVEVNHAIANAPWGANVTGSLQCVRSRNVDFVDRDDSMTRELAVSLNTNPVGGNKFALNAELSHTKTAYTGNGPTGARTDSKATALTLEALYVF